MQAEEFDYQQALRPPEALLGAPCSTSADIWILGCFVSCPNATTKKGPGSLNPFLLAFRAPDW